MLFQSWLIYLYYGCAYTYRPVYILEYIAANLLLFISYLSRLEPLIVRIMVHFLELFFFIRELATAV